MVDKKQLKYLLFDLANLLEKNKIVFWLVGGTCLAAYRDKIFISWDTDMDLGLWEEDYWRVREILDNNNEWKYKHIWRRELCIYKEGYDYHIDLFFHKHCDNKVENYIYLGNPCFGGINIEVKLEHDLVFLPFKRINFLGRSFNIPIKTNEYLTNLYGKNWKIPDENFKYYKDSPALLNRNKDYRTIAIIIPTFLRDEKMQTCVESIMEHCEKDKMFQKWVKIYIGDQGKRTKEKDIFYEKIKKAGHKVFYLPINCGLSYARNFLVNVTKEKFVLIIDDDFKFTKQTDLGKFINILLSNKDLGIVGGKIKMRSDYHYSLLYKKNELCYYLPKKKTNYTIKTFKQKEVSYLYCDIVLNFFLAKREVFNDIMWDNELPLVEHSDYFMRLKATKWKVAYTSEVIVEHQKKQNPSEYNKYRLVKTGINCKIGEERFLKKWGIKRTKKFCEELELNIENKYLSNNKLNKKIKIVQLARIPCANSGYELSKLINNYSNRYESRYILGKEYTKGCSWIPFRKFPYDLFWRENKEKCLEILQNADIIHIHHDYIFDDKILSILKDKMVIITLYNLTNSLIYKKSQYNLDYIKRIKKYCNMITVSDQPLQKELFKDITSINVPLVKYLFNENTEKNNNKPIIVFAPTNRERTGVGNKSYYKVLEIIKKLKQEGYDFEFDLIEGVSYEENLNRKRKADIIIDDIGHEEFHNTSLEGACFGAISLTGYTGEDYPFIKTNIENIEEKLKYFLNNKTKLYEKQKDIVKWRKKYYTPEILIEKYEKIYDELITTKKIETTTINKPKIINIEENSLLNNTQKAIFKEFTDVLTNKNINYCLLKTTCLDAVRFTEPRIEPGVFHLGIDIIDEELIKDFENLGYKYYKTYFSKEHINIYIYNMPRRTKLMGFYGTARNVPYPVVKYLIKLYGNNWREFK